MSNRCNCTLHNFVVALYCATSVFVVSVSDKHGKAKSSLVFQILWVINWFLNMMIYIIKRKKCVYI